MSSKPTNVRRFLSADRVENHAKLQRVQAFVKQLGKKPFLSGNELVVLSGKRRRDGHGGEPELWPEDLNPLSLHQFPEVA
jgi:hypothetical protein